MLWWQGRRTAVTRDHNGLQLEQLLDTGCLSWCTGPASVQYGKGQGLLPANPTLVSHKQHIQQGMALNNVLTTPSVRLHASGVS